MKVFNGNIQGFQLKYLRFSLKIFKVEGQSTLVSCFHSLNEALLIDGVVLSSGGFYICTLQSEECITKLTRRFLKWWPALL